MIFRGLISKLKIKPTLQFTDAAGKLLVKETFAKNTTFEKMIKKILDLIMKTNRQLELSAVVHRVVHGGNEFNQPVIVTKPILKRLMHLEELAPLHQPHNLKAISWISKNYRGLKQIACFDTAFHAGLPPCAKAFGLEKKWLHKGVQRYGFHGISYEFILYQLKKLTPNLKQQKIIIAHLGSGASMCAIKKGKSVDTTMGFSPLDGLLMGTRCGSIDPGVLLYLLSQGFSEKKLQKLLYQESGLLGVSGLTSDMQQLLQEKNNPNVAFAIELFLYYALRHCGSLIATLGGLDLLVFTGGIGEHASIIRKKICEQLGWLGIELDENANQHHKPIISKSTSVTEVRVIPTNEEWMATKLALPFI